MVTSTRIVTIRVDEIFACANGCPGVVAVATCSTPVAASAQSVSDIQPQIEKLMGQVKTLQRQLGSSTVPLFDASGTPLWLNNNQPDVIEKILTHLGCGRIPPMPRHAPRNWFFILLRRIPRSFRPS
jgi:hypothetical protein